MGTMKRYTLEFSKKTIIELEMLAKLSGLTVEQAIEELVKDYKHRAIAEAKTFLDDDQIQEAIDQFSQEHNHGKS